MLEVKKKQKKNQKQKQKQTNNNKKKNMDFGHCYILVFNSLRPPLSWIFEIIQTRSKLNFPQPLQKFRMIAESVMILNMIPINTG